ncbi:hypothetical protein [Pseudomonas atagonensis]|uniref:hypothetical protein n=1 Tax=Pseudomonas atagonensis TaxID=2609964 RepID=UPI00140CBCC5
MSNFPIVATILSMILGLSVTRLLLGALTVFRIRRAAAPDWVALLWAVMLFATQLDFFILPLCAFAAKARKAYTAITLIYLPINALDIVVSLTNQALFQKTDQKIADSVARLD